MVHHSKKGDLVLTFIILLIISISMIFLVTGLGVKIWGVFFPGDDKNTIKSFDTLVNTIKLRASNNNPNYDSLELGVYLGTDYQMIFFGKDDSSIFCGNTVGRSPDNVDVDKPKNCIKNSACICLYKGSPEDINNIVKCESIIGNIYMPDFYFGEATFEANNILIRPNNIFTNDKCERRDNKKYAQIIIGVETSGNLKNITIFEANDITRKYDADKKIFRCPDQDSNSICYGLKDNDNVLDIKGKDYFSYSELLYRETFNKINTQCQAQEGTTENYIDATCIYEKGKDKCRIDCTNVKNYKPNANTCKDLNNNGFFDIYSREYSLCENNDVYLPSLTPSSSSNTKCTLWPTKGFYYCKDNINGIQDGSACGLNLQGCSMIEFSEFKVYTQSRTNSKEHRAIYASLDQSGNCASLISSGNYLEVHNLHVCNGLDQSKCENIIGSSCTIATITTSAGGISGVMIAKYDNTNQQCIDDITKYFKEVYFCS